MPLTSYLWYWGKMQDPELQRDIMHVHLHVKVLAGLTVHSTLEKEFDGYFEKLGGGIANIYH